MFHNTLSHIANSNDRNSMIPLSNSTIIEFSMINVILPSIVFNTGIYRCRTVVATITMTVVVAITTITMIVINIIMIIITSTRLLLLLLRAFSEKS